MGTIPEARPVANPLLPDVCRIRRVVRETHDTFTLEIDAPPRGLTFRPGQFNMLYVFGTGEVPISASGDPAKPHAIVHTTREVGTVTRAMRKLRRGGMLGLRGPYGQPWPLERAVGRDLVLVAGGIGLAPLRPVLYHVAAQRRDFGRIVLLYGTRGPEDLLFRRELERWRSGAGVDIAITVDRAAGAWPGHVGVVTALIPRVPFDPQNAVAFVCGPEIMMRFAAEALCKRGVAAESVFLTMERNMKCAVGFCGHCQFGPSFVCKDGAVFSYPRVRRLLEVREV
jgi:NAD(P)H-flavin reductase